VVSDVILVMYVIRHSVIRAILKHINAYIVVSDLILVMCVRKYSIKRTVL